MKLTGGQAILQLHPSRRCNLSCRHCYSLSGPGVDAALPLALLQQVTREAAGLGYRVVGVSGGEPLLYPELPSLLRTARDAGMRTTVTTNGMLLTERRLSELAPLTDVLAISLDGHPDSHNRLRGNPRAFGVLDRRMKAVERSGIPYAFITTLTLENLTELEFVVAYAQAHGAGGVQVHPLEPEGAALDNLAECVPDAREFVFAIVEGARLSQRYGIPVQVDLAHRAALLRHPEAFLAVAPDPPRPLSSWLSPLVVETDGRVSPLTYGFPAAFALGNVRTRRLTDLVESWDAGPFLELCGNVARQLASGGAAAFNWYEEINRQARRQGGVTAPTG